MSLAQTRRRHFTAEDVYQMLAAGVLREDEPLELLAGDLVVMSPQNPRHAAVTERIRRLLEDAFGTGFYTRTHSPVAVDDESLPEPDVGVFRGTVDEHLDRHPRGDEAALVVEVAATSLAHDRAKASLYARGGVPVYWLVDLAGRRLEVCSEPHAGGYSVTRRLRPGQRVEVPGTATRVAVGDLVD